MSLIGLRQLSTQSLPYKSTEAKVLPHLITSGRTINLTKLPRIVFHIMQLTPRTQQRFYSIKHIKAIGNSMSDFSLVNSNND